MRKINNNSTIAFTLNRGMRLDAESETFVTHTLKAEHDASEDGTGRGMPIVATRTYQGDRIVDTSGPSYTLPAQGANNGGGGGSLLQSQGGVFEEIIPTMMSEGDAHSGFKDEHGLVAGFLPDHGSRAQGIGFEQEMSPTLRHDKGNPGVMHGMAVRRLLPTECEILQGFPRGYTAITYHGKPAADGPRYRAIGNSMATTVMSWLGRRIQMVDEIAKGPVQPEGGEMGSER